MDDPNTSIRIALLSDIHPTFKSKEHGPELGVSQLKMDESRTSLLNPFDAAKELLDSSGQNIDYIFCAGDLGSLSYPGSINYTWTELHKLADLKTSKLLATPGNHDHDSRSVYNEYDPKGFLQSLNPVFPCDFGDDNSHFWAWGFDIVVEPLFKVVVLNTSAFHGINSEYEHGRVTEITCRRIAEKLKDTDDRELNIVLCHHHFHKNEDIKVEGYDAMQGAERLLSTLTDEVGGQWLVIHGHKHFPKIYYANSGSGDAPVIFSTGSFSGDVNNDLGSVAPNQFYVLEFSSQELHKFGLCGKFNSWDWAAGRGWQPASASRGLPSSGGFGHQVNGRIDVQKIAALLNDQKTTITYTELYKSIPEFLYLTPTGIEKLRSEGLTKNLFEIFLENGAIKEIARITK